jgi:hypothetical protein
VKTFSANPLIISEATLDNPANPRRRAKEEPIVVSSPKEVTGCKCNGKTESKWDVSGRRAWGMFIEARIDLVDTSHLDEGDIQPDKFNLEAREAVLAEILGTKIS